MIDFFSEETHVLLNPRMDPDARLRLRVRAEAVGLGAHVWIATSGTSGAMRLVALSKEAVLASAAAVNRRLEAGGSDVWACVLPTFHVGGLGIYARASLSGSRVVSAAWEVARFARTVADERVSLISLVPTQVADLVELRAECPASVRAVIVGGGVLREEDRRAALALGWPVLPSYGMTETASQIATALSPSQPELRLLDHAEGRTDEGRFSVRSSALLTGWIVDRLGSEFVDPKRDGWYLTEDAATVQDGVVTVAGRGADFIKIGGESVDLARLDSVLAGITSKALLVDIPDKRLGSVLHLLTEGADGDVIVSRFNERVLPFERVRGHHYVAGLPRTELGKLSRSEGREQLRRILLALE